MDKLSETDRQTDRHLATGMRIAEEKTTTSTIHYCNNIQTTSADRMSIMNMDNDLSSPLKCHTAIIYDFALRCF